MTATPADAGSPSAGADDCETCGHGWERHGPEAAGCVECPCWLPGESVPSSEATVKPDARCYSAGSGCCGRPGEACAVRPVRGATPPAARTGEDDGADVEPTREDRAVAAGFVRRARAANSDVEVYAVRDRIARDIATERAMSARPLVSGTAGKVTPETNWAKATVEPDNAPTVRDAAYRYLDGLADYADRGDLARDFDELWQHIGPALVPLVSGTAHHDDVARWLATAIATYAEAFASGYDDRRPDIDWQEVATDFVESCEIVPGLLALLGGDQDDDATPVERELWARDDVRPDARGDQGDEDGALATCSDRHVYVGSTGPVTLFCERNPGHDWLHANAGVLW